jgi:hypothetical protein
MVFQRKTLISIWRQRGTEEKSDDLGSCNCFIKVCGFVLKSVRLWIACTERNHGYCLLNSEGRVEKLRDNYETEVSISLGMKEVLHNS